MRAAIASLFAADDLIFRFVPGRTVAMRIPQFDIIVVNLHNDILVVIVRTHARDALPTSLKPGRSVADVGAGNGELTAALAAEVGTNGRVYSNDLDLEQIRATVAAARLSNVTVVQSQTDDASLRRVYHHLTNPAAINASLMRALRPGGVLAVIDFPPLVSWLWALNHGVDVRRVTQEVVASGFQLVTVIEDWPGRGPLGSYCAVFSKRRDAPVIR